MCLNHPETIPPSQGCGKKTSTELVPGTIKVGDCCFREILIHNNGYLLHSHELCVTLQSTSMINLYILKMRKYKEI